MTSSKVPKSIVLGAAAVGVGVMVGAGIAYISTRLMHRSRVTQQIAQLHDNIVEMKQNLAIIQLELGKLHTLPLLSAGTVQDDSTTTSTRRSKGRKNVSFSSSVSQNSYNTAAARLPSAESTTGSFVTADEGSTGDSAANDTDYFSPDEGDDDEFYDLVTSDSEDCSKYNGAGSWSNDVVPASALTELLRRVDAQFGGGSEDDITSAHQTLLDAEKTYPSNSEVLWRLAKSYRNMATLEEKKGNLDMKRSYIFEAYVYAEQSLTVNSSSPDTHKWFAIISGARGEYLGTKERIASGRVFKKHIDAALSYSPNDATLHHLLGRFCYEISGLTWLERKAAAALFGAVPDSSYDEALHHFQAAEGLHINGWKENRLFIAKSLIKLQQVEEVPSWLQKGLSLATATADDMMVDKELQQLVLQYPTPV